MKLSELGEFGLIKEIKGICDNASGDLLLNIGDDAAAVRTRTGIALLSSDMLVEGGHFDLKSTSYYQLGHKVLAVNLSDIYAMGGRPRYFLLNIGVPKKCEINNIKNLYRGLKKLADMHGVAVIGGDTSGSGRDLVLSGTIIGETKRVISRKGAKPGDGIYVAGTLGDSAMGLELLNKSAKHKAQDSLKLCKRHLMPEPAPLKRTKDITAMIDISDGLLIDLSHICDESGVGAMIYSDSIPMSKELSAVAKRSRKDPLDYALKGGEDFVLLFTSPSKTRRDAFRIGEIINRGRYIIDSNGKKQAFRPEGYEHFRK